MKLRNLIYPLALTIISFSACKKSEDMTMTKPDLVFYGLNNANQILQYNAQMPSTAISTVTVSGLASGEKLLDIDFRPATGQLYGISNSSKIYIINQATGVATALSTTGFTPALSGSLVGFNFNPTVDRIRLVTSSGQNLRLHPETGAVAATDLPLNPGSPSIAAAAYTNSMAGASTTVLYDIDVANGKLYKQDPPNNGTLVEVGSLGMVPGTANDAGFDIAPDNSVALATFTNGSSTNLYQVDLNTGATTNLGMCSSNIIGVAIPTKPVAYTVDASNNLQIFSLGSNIGTPISKAITGLQTGENILGIDMRPATGQLFALGSTSRLYTINMSSGAATAISTAAFTTPLVGSSFGFDFNPTVDRIRVVSNTGQNLRLNPLTGDIAAVDLPLNPGTPNVTAVAYTNNFPGATTTVMYDIDVTTNKLYTQNPPNNGTLVEVGNLGITATAENGFDIGGMSNKAYALLTANGSTGLYSINLTTGAATLVSSFPNTVRGFAVGIGF